jgi:hypothetical protein
MNNMHGINSNELVRVLDKEVAFTEQGSFWSIARILYHTVWKDTREFGGREDKNLGYMAAENIWLPTYISFRQKNEEKGEKKDYCIQMLSVFDKKFFDGPLLWYNDELYRGIPGLQEQIPRLSFDFREGAVSVIETNGSGVAPYELVMNQHIPKFLKLHSQAMDLQERIASPSLEFIKEAYPGYKASYKEAI